MCRRVLGSEEISLIVLVQIVSTNFVAYSCYILNIRLGAITSGGHLVVITADAFFVRVTLTIITTKHPDGNFETVFQLHADSEMDKTLISWEIYMTDGKMISRLHLELNQSKQCACRQRRRHKT